MSQNALNGDCGLQIGQQLWNSTVTHLYGAKDLWKSPRGTVIRIEILVSLLAGVLILLNIFGSHRRRSRNWFLQKGVFLAYTLSFSLGTYILGSMQSSGVKSSMYPIWALSFIMLHSGTDSITAYSLDDNKQLTRVMYQALMYFAYAVLLLLTVPTNYTFALSYIALITLNRYIQRLTACTRASNSWYSSKIIADYMYDQQNKSVSDPAIMEDCSYLTDWPKSNYELRKKEFAAPAYAIQVTADHEKDEVIDIGKIWRCKDMSLGPELKDACLSFSLFHLLTRRFFGFTCDESKVRAHNFVFRVLLAENQDGTRDYNRVFKLIELELAFMYDFFFTKSAVMYLAPGILTIWNLISVMGISAMAYVTVRAPVKITQDNSPIISSVTDDIVITLVILASSALLEFLQVLLFWTGIWSRVSFVCQYLREQATSNTGASRNSKCGRGGGYIIIVKEFLAKIGLCSASNKHYWQHKLQQYSLLDSIRCNPNLSVRILNGTEESLGGYKEVARVFVLAGLVLCPWIFDEATRVRSRAGKSVELPGELKEAVIRSLILTDGALSNGKSSLVSNGAPHLAWACEWMMHPDPSRSQRNQNQTHIILTWHIATWYCEMAAVSPDGVVAQGSDVGIATKLSKYCAHLVVCAPTLLPGHHYDTRRKFDAAAAEAVTFLERATNKYEAMKRLTVPQQTESIFESGVKLGKQLEEMAEGVRWKVMADFWAQMILYLAPSDNVQEHVELLAQGGEFITHLWALLFHAGILERDQEPPSGEE
ncbi:unnamed protein product [Alopecurus aequalis]